MEYFKDNTGHYYAMDGSGVSVHINPTHNLINILKKDEVEAVQAKYIMDTVSEKEFLKHYNDVITNFNVVIF